MAEVAAPQIPAELFSFCIAANPGPFDEAAFCCTPAFVLAVLHNEPKTSPPDDATGFGAGLPRLAIEVAEVYVDDADGVADGVLAAKEGAWLEPAVLMSARTDVK